MDVPQFIHSSGEAHLNFQVLMIRGKAALNICIQVSFYLDK